MRVGSSRLGQMGADGQARLHELVEHALTANHGACMAQLCNSWLGESFMPAFVEQMGLYCWQSRGAERIEEGFVFGAAIVALIRFFCSARRTYETDLEAQSVSVSRWTLVREAGEGGLGL